MLISLLRAKDTAGVYQVLPMLTFAGSVHPQEWTGGWEGGVTGPHPSWFASG